MKTQIQKLLKTLYMRLPGVGLAAILLGIMLPLVAFAWGPDRPTFTTQVPATYVTFNSITNNPAHGDERNFMQVRESTASNETYADSIALNPGKEYVVYMYYHNNAAANYNASGVGIAHGAFARAEVPAVVKNGSTGTKAVGYVGATNANPQQVWDDISFSNTSGGDIALRYVPGSATIHNFGPTNGHLMSDSIITTGASLGYDALNGDLPGCNDYAGYVTFRVKADQPNFTVQKQVRKPGTTEWKDSVSLKPGEEAEYMISYKNTGTTQQNDVVVKDSLPKGMTYVVGSSKLMNGSNPNGAPIADGVTAGGIRIGNYAPGATAFVLFRAKVADAKDLKCGANTLTNTAKVETNNGNKGDPRCEPCVPKDGEVVDKNGNCVPGELPTTGPAQIIAGILGVALVALGVAYWIRSRNSYKKALSGMSGEVEAPKEELFTSRDDAKSDDEHHARNLHK
jgi:uncharacterized repeat protein (TIGR01451 family)